ncbi:MAG TPA: SAM-dependent methyltransferase, partial [Nocardioidaceae bacterium]|nr:SAM-dependent methyltransferase [Nocardioidaceae bacterium]
HDDGDLALMVKPQFEVGKDRVGKGGVVRDLDLRADAVAAVAAGGARRGWGAQAVTTSPLPGPSGNVEFFLWLRHADPAVSEDDITTEVRRTPALGASGEKVEP